METCVQTGRVVTVVSNNTPAAVRTFLVKHNLGRYVAFVAGRSDESPALMKPNPHLLIEASRAVHVPPNLSVLIGDSTSDIEAAHAAGASAIGYTNKPGKAEAFTELGVDAIVTDMREVAVALGS
jgi:beta-phosphoglucomutase-like phosphatase (HAD superfamily)